MKKHLIICFALFAGLAFGQNKTEAYDSNTVFSSAAVDLKKPEFPGGFESFYKAFAAEFKLPAENPDLKGHIFVKFVVEKDGSLSDIKILRDLGMGTGAETVRAIRKLPNWKPAKYQEKVVRCEYHLTIKIPCEPLNASQFKIIEIPDKH